MENTTFMTEATTETGVPVSPDAVTIEVICYSDADGVQSVRIDRPGAEVTFLCLDKYRGDEASEASARRIIALRSLEEWCPVKMVVKDKQAVVVESLFPVQVTVRQIPLAERSIYA